MTTFFDGGKLYWRGPMPHRKLDGTTSHQWVEIDLSTAFPRMGQAEQQQFLTGIGNAMRQAVIEGFVKPIEPQDGKPDWHGPARFAKPIPSGLT